MTTSAARGTASALHLLHRAGQCADALFMAAQGADDLTPRQFAVLETLAALSKANQSELGTRTGIDRSTMTDILLRLQRRGYVKRRRHARDRRVYVAELTAAGAELLRRSQEGVVLANQQLLAPLKQRQREDLVKALRAIAQTGA